MSDIEKYAVTIRKTDDEDSPNRRAVMIVDENGEVIYYSPDAIIEAEPTP